VLSNPETDHRLEPRVRTWAATRNEAPNGEIRLEVPVNGLVVMEVGTDDRQASPESKTKDRYLIPAAKL
jgi:hypothetical protein